MQYIHESRFGESVTFFVHAPLAVPSAELNPSSTKSRPTLAEFEIIRAVRSRSHTAECSKRTGKCTAHHRRLPAIKQSIRRQPYGDIGNITRCCIESHNSLIFQW